ncbi:MAG: nicotinamide riboside transporter PnuC, partial [Armatimonadota bacterium]
ILVAFVLGTSIYVPVITHFKADWIWIDSILTVTSIIAQVLVNMKKIENWILWIAVNTAYIPVYKAKGYYSLVYLSAILLVLAGIGLIKWIKAFHVETPKAEA